MSLADRLAARTLELVDVPSPSRAEDRLATHVLRLLQDGGVEVHDADDTCVLAGARVRGDRPLVLLAGHFDTVPAQENLPGRRAADAIHGLGAADMKGALAVMIELALARLPTTVDLGFVFFGREELTVSEGALTPLLERERGLRAADLAIVMEPTANALQAGCLGNLNATWTFHGRSGHSARPWLADNAIHRAGAGIAALATVEPVVHDLDGLQFTEVISATGVQGGIAVNVIPDRAVVQLNMRYAPGTSPEQAAARLHAICDPYGELTIDGNAPSGPLPGPSALLDRLLEAAQGSLEPKQAWTPVAELGAVGVDSVNFGPGDPAYAHARDELVRIDALVRSYETLAAFACR